MSMTENEIKYKIILIADSNVGKTYMFKKIPNDAFCEKNISTIGMDRKSLNLEIKTNKEGEPEKKENCEIQIWDTAGQERFRSITTIFYRSSQGVLLIYDITNRDTFDNLHLWIQNIKDSLGNDDNYLIYLIGHKSELIDESQDQRKVTTEEGESLCKENGIIWGGEYNIKNLTKEELKNLFQKISELIFQKVGRVVDKREVIKNPQKRKKKLKC